MARKLSDAMVHPRVVLDCLVRLQSRGTQAALHLLEQTEPDLANYVLETLSKIHHDLLGLNGPTARTRRVYRQIELMALVCIESLRQSHFELWQEQAGPDSANSDSDAPPEER